MPARLDSLTGLRWLAALAVFVHHGVALAPINWLGYFSWLGSSGVAFFFILSGFVLAWSARDGDPPRAFYRRRFARIYPLHIVALLLAVPVWYGDADVFQIPFEWAPFMLAVVLLQGWFPVQHIFFAGNPVAWSLSYEAFFYALFPRLGRRSSTPGRWLAIAAGALALPILLVALVVLSGLSGLPAELVLRTPLSALPMFVAGMALARAMRQGWRPPWSQATAWMVLGLSAVGLWTFIASGAADSVGPYRFVLPVMAPAFAAVVASVASADMSRRPSWLTTWPMLALGTWSYAFYLIHSTVIHGLRLALGGPVQELPTQLLAFVAALSLSITLAWALHRFVERPAERRLRVAPRPRSLHGVPVRRDSGAA